jgi:hypothetical protein
LHDFCTVKCYTHKNGKGEVLFETLQRKYKGWKKVLGLTMKESYKLHRHSY